MEKFPMYKLADKRKRAGLTQSELAERVGLKYAAISSYETGVSFPKRKTLEKMAEVLNCNAADLI